MIESITPLPFEQPQDPKQPKSKPFNWNVSDVVDYSMRLQFTNSMQKMIEEIRRDKVELMQWRYVALRISMGIPGTDISTPEKFLKVQVARISETLDENDNLQDALQKERAARVEAFQQIEKLTTVLATVDKTSETAWHNWLFKRDQVLNWKPTGT